MAITTSVQADENDTESENPNYCWPGNFAGYFAIDKKIQCLVASKDNPFTISPHRANYALPLTYYRSPEDPLHQNAEIKFQFSVMSVIKRNLLGSPAHLLFAYTSQSYWQAFNSDLSSPFRETNHEPEVMLAFPTNWGAFGVRNRLLTFGFSHQSNGETVPQSRSWNRLTAEATLEHGNLYSSLRTWYRIPEKRKDDVQETEGDDNPDIEKYMGHFEWRTIYKTDSHSVSVMLRNNLRRGENKGAAQIDYTYPINGKIQGYVQLFHGYGESLIDYNRSVTRFGLGVMLANWL